MYSFSYLEPVCGSMSSSSCCFRTCKQISQEAVSSGLVFPSLSEFSSVYCDPHSQRLWHSQWSRNRCFSGNLLLFWSSSRCWQFGSGCSVFSKIQLEHLEVHGSHIAEAWLGEFWALHYIYIIISVWDEFNCVLVWAFFGIAILRDWNENWSFLVLWPLLSFPNLLAYWV